MPLMEFPARQAEGQEKEANTKTTGNQNDTLKHKLPDGRLCSSRSQQLPPHSEQTWLNWGNGKSQISTQNQALPRRPYEVIKAWPMSAKISQVTSVGIWATDIFQGHFHQLILVTLHVAKTPGGILHKIGTWTWCSHLELIHILKHFKA